VYQQLSSEQLGSMSKDNFDIANDPVFANASSEDELRRLNLVGQASNMQSQSGPIPGTGRVELYANTTSVTEADFFTPSEGESWQLLAAQTKAFYTGQSSAELFISDGTTSVSLDRPTSAYYEFALGEPIYITYPCKLVISFGGTGTGGTGQVTVALHRVR
jgi:hypothetical protein